MNLELTEEQDLVVAMVGRFVREEILLLEHDLSADELDAADRARWIEKLRWVCWLIFRRPLAGRTSTWSRAR